MQVYSGDKLVGHLNVDPSRVRGRHYEIRTMDMPEPSFIEEGMAFPDTSIATRRLMLEVKLRGFAISDYDIHIYGEKMLEKKLRANNVPDDAEKDVDPMRMTRRYRWRCLSVDVAQHEELFDMDDFVPV